MARKAPGKSHREGMTIVELMEIFPTEEAATEWFEATIWPKDAAGVGDEPETDLERANRAVSVRAHDQQVLAVMYPSMRPRLSARSETFYWKGLLPLVDGTEAELRVLEVEDDAGLAYYPRVNPASAEVGELCETSFRSASEAMRALELRLNRAIYWSARRSEG